MFTSCQHTVFSFNRESPPMLHKMNDDITPDMQRFYEAAMKHTNAKSWADIGRLINESDQTVTNWKRRGIPESKLLDVATAVKANPYWIRDGGDLTMTNIYAIDKDLSDLLRVAEPLPKNYKRFLIQESVALAELVSKPKPNGTQ